MLSNMSCRTGVVGTSPDVLLLQDRDGVVGGGGVLCYPTLDRTKVDFPGFRTMTGWLRHRDNAGRPGRCIRLRCGA